MKTGDQELSEIDRKHIWHPFTSFGDSQEPIFIKSAKGLYLETSDGRSILDAVSSWWVNLHGHSNPELAAAAARQASTLEHVIFAGFTHEPAIRLASNLLKVLPVNQSRIFFSDNGSTAVEVGIKMALQYWHNQKISKRKVIAFEGAYHGDTFGAMSVGGRSLFTAAFDPFLFDVEFIDIPNDQNIDKVVDRFRGLASSGEVAAFIYEPLVQGAAGMIMYSENHLDLLMEEAARHEIICIADEVFTGFGRTGKWFATHFLKHVPDIMSVSKGITGGTLPLGVTSCSEKIVKAFASAEPSHTFFHGHSYTANPIACAVANASFEIMTRSETWTRIGEIGSMHEKFVNHIKHHSLVRNARSRGTIMALEIDTRENTSYFNAIRKNSYRFFLERNILLRPLGNVIYILPPYVITPQELNVIYGAIEDFLTTLGE